MKIFNFLNNVDNLASSFAEEGLETDATRAAMVSASLTSYLAQLENAIDEPLTSDTLEILNAWKATNDEQLANFVGNDNEARITFETQGALANAALELYHSWTAQIAHESAVEA